MLVPEKASKLKYALGRKSFLEGIQALDQTLKALKRFIRNYSTYGKSWICWTPSGRLSSKFY